ncbi:sensor histidine kinase [Streptomyces sp. NPDC058052]|uniref:sensor histidine kinase n=1 Tax=Streptomyces sp. NPDC058052 TaxID=3346316 RepID=UPI0036E93A82
MLEDGNSPRLARVIVRLVAVGFCFAAVVATSANREGIGPLMVASAILVATLGLHLRHSARVTVRRRRPWWPWSLVAHGAVTYGPYLFFQDTWVGIPGSFAAAVLLTTPLPHAWTAFGALAVLQVPLTLALGETTGQALNSAVSHAVGGLALFGVARLADLTEELQSARAELTQRAVDHERLRFARDLHDLCGYSLTAVTLQCEGIQRFVRSDGRRAEEELVRTQALARQALSEMRAVSSGYRVLSLAREAQSAAELLRTLGVDVDLELAEGLLPGQIDETLAIVVREAVTNVLRHSKARHCEIRLTAGGGRTDRRWVRLEVSNDGAADAGRAQERAAAHPRALGGSGLRNLRERASEQGGLLTVETEGKDLYRLSVTLPWQLRTVLPAPRPGTSPTRPDGVPRRR